MDIKLTPYLSKMPLDGEMINKIKLLTIRNWIYSDFFNIHKKTCCNVCYERTIQQADYAI